jgi:hypothetical protein
VRQHVGVVNLCFFTLLVMSREIRGMKGILIVLGDLSISVLGILFDIASLREKGEILHFDFILTLY